MSVAPRAGGWRGDPAQDLAAALATAARVLAAAGVPSPRADAEALAAHLLGVGRGDVRARALVGAPVPIGFADLVADRARRVPLQHLVGRAPFRGLDLAVGPGVFVPRPETEGVAGLAIAEAQALARRGAAPVVVDLCTGSGAIALAVTTEVPTARVVAVELDPQSLAWARRNLDSSPVDLRAGDAGDAAAVLLDLLGGVDVVVSNPPYVPPGAVPVDPEVREHDPAAALFGGGPDGLALPRRVLAAAADLLRPGGLVVCEHADVQQEALIAELAAGPWQDARGHPDLTGRPRSVTARRRPR